MDEAGIAKAECISPDNAGSTDNDEVVPRENEERSSVEKSQDQNQVPMSKRKRKKLEQKLRKQQYLKDKRQKERLRKKERLKVAKSQGIDVGPSRKALKHNTMEKSQCKVKVVIDCSFDNLMTEKDIKSIVKQVNFCYAANRRAVDPLQFHITSFTGQVKETMDSIGDYHKWDINVHTCGFLEAFDKQDVIYLSSDSKNVLDSLDDNQIYVIGGLVDHNHHKGLCLELAEKRGLKHAQLPIGAYVSLESRTTLAVNHVFEILLRFTESHDWKEAFYKVIPKRKVTTATGSQSEQPDNSNQSSEETLPSNINKTDTRTVDSDEYPLQGEECASQCAGGGHLDCVSVEHPLHQGALNEPS